MEGQNVCTFLIKYLSIHRSKGIKFTDAHVPNMGNVANEPVYHICSDFSLTNTSDIKLSSLLQMSHSSLP